VINLLCKGSSRHLEKQLRKTPDEHLCDILDIVSMSITLAKIVVVPVVLHLVNYLKGPKIEWQVLVTLVGARTLIIKELSVAKGTTESRVEREIERLFSA